MEQFNDLSFSVIALTAALNERPYAPGQISASGIFEEDFQAVTTVKIEREGKFLNLVEPSPRGGPGETFGGDDRELVPFEMHHFQIDDAIFAEEVQGVKMLGSVNQLETLQARIDSRMDRYARSLDATLEHQRVGAIKGLVTSKSGKVLHDLYARFGLAAPAPVAIGIDADVAGLASALKAEVILPLEDDLDATYSGLHAYCGPEFHAALWDQKEVRETFIGWSDAATLRNGAPDTFTFGGVVWERYRTGKSARAQAGAVDFIAPDSARIVPVGVPGLFMTIFGPADYEETVNTIALPRYMRQYPMPNGKGRNLEAQSNSLSICTRPAALRHLTIG